jgi:hypothetical protein
MRKIVNARPDFDPMTEAEVDSFLESKLNVQQLLATVDQTGDPNIQPFSLWFYYDKGDKKSSTSRPGRRLRRFRIFVTSPLCTFRESSSKRCQEQRNGKTIFEHSRRVVPIAEKIYLKYLGTLDHPDDAKMLIEYARNGNTVLLEISHKFFSAWDTGNAQ